MGAIRRVGSTEALFSSQGDGRFHQSRILEGLWSVLVLARLHQPLRVLLGLVHAEASRAEQRLRRQHAVLGAHDLRGGDGGEGAVWRRSRAARAAARGA